MNQAPTYKLSPCNFEESSLSPFSQKHLFLRDISMRLSGWLMDNLIHGKRDDYLSPFLLPKK